MSDVILYQYPESPFSEKIRTLLGYKNASYLSVQVPVIQPKPDLMAVSGGYRKTPVMQIGADIYCDTALMARVIDARYPEPSVYPAAIAAAAVTVSQWTDSELFRAAVTLVFQPRGMASSPLFSDEQALAAFVADRAEFTRGSDALAMPAEEGRVNFVQHLQRLDRQLASNAWLLGDVVTIADFSTYHICWFIYANEGLRDIFDGHDSLLGWLERMRSMGHGSVREISGAAAREQARGATPLPVTGVDPLCVPDLQAGDKVEITPTDYGFFPVTGRLVQADLEELVVSQQDDDLGEMHIHFPRRGFSVSKAG